MPRRRNTYPSGTRFVATKIKKLNNCIFRVYDSIIDAIATFKLFSMQVVWYKLLKGRRLWMGSGPQLVFNRYVSQVSVGNSRGLNLSSPNVTDICLSLTGRCWTILAAISVLHETASRRKHHLPHTPSLFCLSTRLPSVLTKVL